MLFHSKLGPNLALRDRGRWHSVGNAVRKEGRRVHVPWGPVGEALLRGGGALRLDVLQLPASLGEAHGVQLVP